MKILEQQIQKIRKGKWEELEELDKRYAAMEERVGFPPKKRYRCISGIHGLGDLVIERQWESMAALEAAYEKLLADPEYHKLTQESGMIIEENHLGLYMLLP